MRAMDRALSIMARLRHPTEGCPWDREQTFASIAPYTIEEAYEVADAIGREAWAELLDELGDLLLQVVYHARIAEERGLFDFDAVADALARKLVRRHPHVFGDAGPRTHEELSVAWDAIKAQERAERAAAGAAAPGAVDDVPRALPALARAQKLQTRAARAGLDHEPERALLDALCAALGELSPALLARLLGVCAREAARAGMDPEAVLRGANDAFETEVRALERARDAPRAGERTKGAGEPPV
jgi:MazG family protein